MRQIFLKPFLATFFLGVVGVILSFSMVSPAEAANRYWAGGASDRWELSTNWASVPKGAGGAGVPGASDTAILNNSGSTVRIRSAVNVGGLIMAQVWTGSLLQGTGTLTIGTSGARIGSGRLVGGNAAIAIAGTYTQTGGIVTGIQNNFTLSGALSVTKGASSSFSTFTSTGTIILDGNADQGFTVGANVSKTFKNLTLNNSGGGSSDDVAVNVNGGLNLSGALTITLGNLDLTTNSMALVVKGGMTLADAAQATLTTNSNVTASGTILVNDSATLTVSGGTWTLNDDGDQAVDFDGQALNALTINNTGGGSNDDVVVAGGALQLSGALTVTLGNLDMDSNALALNVDGNMTLADAAQSTFSGATLNVGGNLTVNDAATFSHTTGTVTLDGTSQTLSGAITFDSLQKNVSSETTLSFAAGRTVTVRNTLTLSGSSFSNMLLLRSTLAGTQWNIDPQGTRTLEFLDVKDSENTNATAILCTSNCVNNGNNTNWTFRVDNTTQDADTSNAGGGGGGGGRRAARIADEAGEDTDDDGDGVDDETGLPSRNGLLEVIIDGEIVVLRDVSSSSWFAQYVFDIVRAGVASGYRDERGNPTGMYGPGNSVTYAEIAKMALEAAGEDPETATGLPMNRMARDHWAKKYILLAEAMGLSVYDQALDLNRPATRGHVIQTIMEALGVALTEAEHPYSDVASSHANAAAIATATALGIVSGDTNADGELTGKFRPDSWINRAEVAKIISIVLELGL